MRASWWKHIIIWKISSRTAVSHYQCWGCCCNDLWCEWVCYGQVPHPGKRSLLSGTWVVNLSWCMPVRRSFAFLLQTLCMQLSDGGMLKWTHLRWNCLLALVGGHLVLRCVHAHLQKAHGLLQFAVALLSFMFLIVVRAVDNTALPCAYADNWGLQCGSIPALQRCINAVADFCQRARLIISVPQSWIWASHPKVRK